MIRLSTNEVVGKCIIIHEILWHEDGWATKLIKGNVGTIGFITKGLKVHSEFCEVIGDIFENPELIKVE